MEKKKDVSLVKIIRKLFPMVIIACPYYIILTNLVAIFHGASLGFNTFMTQKFFDSVASMIGGGALSKTIIIGIGLGAALIGNQFLNGLHNFMGSNLYNKVNGKLYLKISEKAARLEPIAFENPSTLDHINKANQGMGNSLGLLMTLSTLLTFYIPYFTFMGVYMFRLKPILAISLVLIFIPVALNQFIRTKVFANLADESAPVRRRVDYYEKCICDREYFKETRILGAFSYFLDLYKSSVEMLNKKIWRAEFKTGLIELGMKLLTLLGYLGVLYLLFDSLIKGDISVGSFGAVFASIGLMFDVMEEIISRHIGSLTKDLGTVANFISFLELEERKGEDVDITEVPDISIKNAFFKYPGSDKASIIGVSIDVRAGETIAIVGENGAGKTTLVRLMTGLYLPSEGVVTIGGYDTRNISAKSVYKGISAVFQKFQRYKLTLSENIMMSSLREDVSAMNLQINEAINKAGLEIKEESFPQKLDTMLSREFDGVDISGGQWQRVAIARGLYRFHNMIILDEPTAAIDPIEETKIYNEFAEISKGKTSIIVTHRLGSAKIADRIIVMDKGRIAEVGSHEELINNSGIYAEMYNAQLQWYV